jgi:hypothetical protein
MSLTVGQTIRLHYGSGGGNNGVLVPSEMGRAVFWVRSQDLPDALGGQLVELFRPAPVVTVVAAHSATVLFPEGIGFIHLPLKVTAVDGQPMAIQTISDLFDALGGPENVNFILTRDAAAGVWRSYLGDSSKGTPADRTLTDDLGMITVMYRPVTLHLTGEGLGTDGTGRLHLNRGINLIGLPIKDARLKRVSDLLSLEGLVGKAMSMIVLDAGDGTFKVVVHPGDAGDIDITGGQAFLVIAREAGIAFITGVAWDEVIERTRRF